MENYKGLDIIPFLSLDAWLEWLSANHVSSPGIWLKFAKKSSNIASITYEGAREGALLYGWIDGQKNSFDQYYYLIRFTPRRSKSVWSKVNVQLVEQFIAEGRMHPAGLAQVEAAKKDGRWAAAYDSQSTMTMPADFKQALATSPTAEAFYAGLKKAQRYSFLYRLQNTKSDKREAVIEKFIGMLENGETFRLY